jgi:glucose-1-phosphate cytidylyltransferase
MKVVILCGGKGTRLREETELKPKPMVEIGGKPILWHIMKSYEQHGFVDFILCLGYQQQYIREYFLNYQYMNRDFRIDLATGSVELTSDRCPPKWRVTLVDTGTDTQKGGRMKRVEQYLTEPTFMMTYGDGVADVDHRRVLDHHEKSGLLATFTGVHPISRFATVDVDTEGRITDWNEKKALESRINGGFFVLDRRVLEYIDGDCEFEEAPMKQLAREGQVTMYPHDGFWHCMDTYRDYLWLNQVWDKGNAPWKSWTGA